MMHSKSLQNVMITKPSLRWLNMKLLSSPHISSISGLQIPGKEHYKSPLHISRRNYVYWIVWWRNLTRSPRLHALFFSNKYLSPFWTSEPPPEDLHQDPLLTMVHDLLSQAEICDSSNIAQLLSVIKSTTCNDSRFTAKVNRQYSFARANKAATQLNNRGANGGLARSNMHVLKEMSHKINVVGINNHELTGLPLVTNSMVLHTNCVPIMGIFHEYSH